VACGAATRQQDQAGLCHHADQGGLIARDHPAGKSAGICRNRAGPADVPGCDHPIQPRGAIKPAIVPQHQVRHPRAGLIRGPDNSGGDGERWHASRVPSSRVGAGAQMWPRCVSSGGFSSRQEMVFAQFFGFGGGWFQALCAKQRTKGLSCLLSLEQAACAALWWS